MEGIVSKIILPPSAELLQLLKVCFIITMILYIPFLTMTIGGLISALSFDLMSDGPDCPRKEIARVTLQKLFPARHYGMIYGVIPIFTVLVVYAQSLYGAPVNVFSFFLTAAFAGLIGFYCFYKYRDSLQFSYFTHKVQGSMEKATYEVKEMAQEYHDSSNYTSFFGAALSLVFLLWSSYMFIGGMDSVLHPQQWSEITSGWHFVVSASFWFKYCFFLSACMAVGSAAMLMFMLKKYDCLSDEAYSQAKAYASYCGLYATLCMPLFALLYAAALPSEAFSARIVLYMLFALVLLFLAAARFSTAAFSAQRRGGSYTAFVLLVLALMFTTVSDNVAKQNATQQHTVKVLSGQLGGAHANHESKDNSHH